MEALEQRAEKAAQDAKCRRCHGYILSSPLKQWIATLSVRTLATGETVHVSLCGPCGGELEDFLNEGAE